MVIKLVEKDGTEVVGETLEIVAGQIERLAEIGKTIKASRLTETAILLLLRHHTGLGMGDIEKVLNALPDLSVKYLKPRKK